MLISFSAFTFEDSMENGREAVELGIFRAQSYKLVEKLVWQLAQQFEGLK